MKRILSKAVAGVLAMAMTLALVPVVAFAAAGSDFEITGGTSGTDYNYEDGVLTVLTGTELTISMADSIATTDDTILINDGVAANITLDNVTINTTTGTAIKANANDTTNNNVSDITITGVGTINITAKCAINNLAGGIYLKGDAEWLIDTSASYYKAISAESGDVIISGGTWDLDSKYVTMSVYYGEIIIEEGVGVTSSALVSAEYNPGEVTVEGSASLITSDVFADSLIIESDASLTVTDASATNIYTLAIESDGTLILPDDVTEEEIATMNITGSGTVKVDGVAYDNTGVIVPTTTSGSRSYYIKATATGNGTVAPEDEDVSPDSMYKVTKGSDVTFEFDADSGYEVTDVIVNDKSVGACDEYEFEDIIFTMQTIEVVFEKKSGSSSDDDDDEDEDAAEDEDEVVEEVVGIVLPFADVDEENDNYEGIAYVYDEGIMAGISEDVFGSDLSITRGMIAAILYRINGSVPVNAIMPFADVTADQYYYEAVNWGKAEGVIAGMSETEFAADEAITQEQFIAFLYRYATVLGMDMDVDYDYDLSGYGISAYAYTAIAWALENDIIDEDDLDATATAMRGDVATALMNFMEMM